MTVIDILGLVRSFLDSQGITPYIGAFMVVVVGISIIKQLQNMK